MKTYNFTLSIILLLFLSYQGLSQESSWLKRLKQMPWMTEISQLELLKTSRLETEQILGKPRVYDYETADFIQEYTLKNGRVNITYTTQNCESKNGKINKDLVERINYFDLKQDIKFSSLKIPKRK